MFSTYEHFADAASSATCVDSTISLICGLGASISSANLSVSRTFSDVTDNLQRIDNASALRTRRKISAYTIALTKGFVNTGTPWYSKMNLNFSSTGLTQCADNLNDLLARFTDTQKTDPPLTPTLMEALSKVIRAFKCPEYQQYWQQTVQLIDAAETALQSVYQQVAAFGKIRNQLIALLNVDNDQINSANLLCIKSKVQSASLAGNMSQMSVNVTKFTDLLTAWCSVVCSVVTLPQPGQCSANTGTTTNTGGSDSHGCLLGAGQSWNSAAGKCQNLDGSLIDPNSQVISGAANTSTTTNTGGSDSHGCLLGAGQSWNSAAGKCQNLDGSLIDPNSQVISGAACDMSLVMQAAAACATPAAFVDLMAKYNPTAFSGQSSSLSTCIAAANQSANPSGGILSCITKWVGTCNTNGNWIPAGGVQPSAYDACMQTRRTQMSACTTPACYQSFMTTNNPNANATQYQSLQQCLSPQTNYDACMQRFVGNCSPTGDWSPAGPIASQSPTPTLTPSPASDSTWNSSCTNSNDYVLMRSDLDTYVKIKDKFNVDKVNQASGSCPVTKMKYDDKKGEYDIQTHPDITYWGVQTPMCGKGAAYSPDWVVQKHGGADNPSRCQSLSDYVPKSKYSATEQKLQNCTHAFNNQCGATAAGKGTGVLETFAADSSTACAANQYSIKNHVQYADYMKDYMLKSDCKPVSAMQLQDVPGFTAYDANWNSKLDAANKQIQANSRDLAVSNQKFDKMSQVASAYSQDLSSNIAQCKAALQKSTADNKSGQELSKNLAQCQKDMQQLRTDQAKCKDASQYTSIADIQSLPAVNDYINKLNQQYASQLGSINKESVPKANCLPQDITKHPDITKYVLKSSVPDCKAEAQVFLTALQKNCDASLATKDQQIQQAKQLLTAKDAQVKNAMAQCNTLKDKQNLQQVRDKIALAMKQKDDELQQAAQKCHADMQKWVKSNNKPTTTPASTAPSKSVLPSDLTSQQQQQSQVCSSSKPLSSYPIQQHPDFSNYVPKSSVQQQQQEQQQRIIQLRKQISNYVSANQKSAAAQATNTSPDLSKYVLRTDVVPCPDKAKVIKDVGSDIQSYLDSNTMRQACKTSGFLGNSKCAQHFPKSVAEGFTDQNNAENAFSLDQKVSCKLVYPTYPQNYQSTDPYDVMSHNDYKYSDTTAGHMPKGECYGTYAAFDTSGNPISCQTALQKAKTACDNRPITQHRDYEATVMKFGGVKDTCGRLQPAGTKTTTSNTKNLPDCSACQSDLMKEKMKYRLLLERYRGGTKAANAH